MDSKPSRLHRSVVENELLLLESDTIAVITHSSPDVLTSIEEA